MHGGARAEKQRIRQEARIISEGLTPEYRREASREITRQVLALPAWQKAKTVMAYVSMPEEPDTKEIIEAALKEGKTLLLPCCVDRENMVAVPVTDLSGMKTGRLGIPEPEPLPEPEPEPEPVNTGTGGDPGPLYGRNAERDPAGSRRRIFRPVSGAARRNDDLPLLSAAAAGRSACGRNGCAGG